MVKESDWTGVSESVQQALLGRITEEFKVAKKNNDTKSEDLDKFYNMLHAIRDRQNPTNGNRTSLYRSFHPES